MCRQEWLNLWEGSGSRKNAPRGGFIESPTTEQGIHIIRPSGTERVVSLKDKTLGAFEERPDGIQTAVIVVVSGRRHRTSGILTDEESGALLPIWQFRQASYSPLT